MSSRFKKLAGLTALLALTSANAQEPINFRVWSDSSGSFSAEAALLDYSSDTIRLQRPSGLKVSVEYRRLSDADRAFIDSLRGTATGNSNSLRDSPTTGFAGVSPSTPQLPAAASPSLSTPSATHTAAMTEHTVLDLPAATFAASDDVPLGTTAAMRSDIRWPVLRRIAEDPMPTVVSLAPCVVSLGSLDGWTECSRPVVVKDGEKPTLIVSITRGLALPGLKSQNQILSVDPASSQSTMIWEGDRRITLFDHHLPTSQTLVLDGHTSIGEGGGLAFVKLSKTAPMQTLVRHSIPSEAEARNAPKLRWARFVDDEHVIAIVDQSLYCWNLVSAQCLYRIDKIDPRVTPVQSSGRRYFALPQPGSLLLYNAENGYPLGGIQLDKGVTPTVSFSRDGQHIAIVSGKRLRIWNLASGSVANDTEHRLGLGGSDPVWVNEDLVMTGNGTLFSRSRNRVVWRYEVIGDDVSMIGNRIALLRKYTAAELVIVDLPHPAAASQFDRSSKDDGRIAKSKWKDGSWVE